ncbi:hypothetical protein VTH06DRAFT_647 [Thermothelomyces fergusii]
MTSPKPPSSDQSLLERLNALKPTGITFDKPNPASATGPGNRPESNREDALTARLRTLRSQTSGEKKAGEGAPPTPTPTPTQPAGRPDAARDGAGGAATPPFVDRAGTPPQPPSSASPAGHRSPRHSELAYQLADPHVDEDDEEEAVDELLAALADEDVAALVAAEDVEPAPRRGGDEKEDDDDDDDDDDSDGEQMARAVEAVLSQIRDQIRSLPPPGAAAPPAEDGRRAGSAGAEQQPAGDRNGDEPAFTLPSAPSRLPGPAATATEDAFERDMAARLASLRGLGRLDELGLPSAPTFRPQDRGPSSSLSAAAVPVGKDLLRPGRDADADADGPTWCVVCLGDAAVRCVGCDGDVYCARCWRDMHVGPSAGYDERGHQWARIKRDAPR